MRLFRATDHHYSQIPLQTLKMVEVPRIIFQTPPSPRNHSPPVSILPEASPSSPRHMEQTGHLPTTENVLPVPTAQRSGNAHSTPITHKSENILPAPVTHKSTTSSYPGRSSLVVYLSAPIFGWSQAASAEKESILSGFTPEELEDLPPGFPYTDWTGGCALGWELMGSLQRFLMELFEGQGGSGKRGAVRGTT